MEDDEKSNSDQESDNNDVLIDEEELAEIKRAKKIEKEQKIPDLKSDDQKGNVSVKLDLPTDFEDKIEYKNAYKIYNSKFDEVIFPTKLVNKNELEK